MKERQGLAMTGTPATTYIVSVFDKPHWRTRQRGGEAQGFLGRSNRPRLQRFQSSSSLPSDVGVAIRKQRVDCLHCGAARFRTVGKAHWKACAVTVDSTIAGILEECGSGSDTGLGALGCRSRLRSPVGFDRAVLFWDSAVNDSLKCSGTN